jgi:transcriptional regulator with XRE-family HTH domain
MEIGKRIRIARRNRGFSLGDLARASRLSKGFLSQVESGASMPSVTSLRRIAEALGIAIHKLLGDPISDEIGLPEQALSAPTVSRAESMFDAQGRLAASLTTGAFLASYFSLRPSENLVSSPQPSGITDQAVCLVITGTLALHTDGHIITLQAGEMARFQLADRYRLAAGRTGVEALLVLPANADMPSVGVSDVLIPERIAPSSTETGPFRLVAMRAERNRARRAG